MTMKEKLGFVFGMLGSVAVIAWVIEGRGPWGLALGLLLSALFLLWCGYMIRRARMVLVTAGFFILLSGVFSSYANWLPQVEGPVPPPDPPRGARPEEMSLDRLAEQGERLIFGNVGTLAGQGKGQCPLCHAFSEGVISERAPSLVGISTRAAKRLNDPRYLHPDSVQTESFSGSGRATTAEEYIAESHVCPSCFVAAGYGTKGTNDHESPMAEVHKPPIGLSIDELIAVDTFLFYREGGDVPPVSEIRAAYEKFIPPSERQERTDVGSSTIIAEPTVALASDTLQEIIAKLGCPVCHKIPSTTATVGVIGPLLIEKTNAPKRIASREYQGRVKAGKAHASTPKEYVMESIVNPSAFIVPGFAQASNPEVSPMPRDFGKRLTYNALDKLAEFLLSLDEAAAIGAGMLPAQQTPSGDHENRRQAVPPG